MRTNRFFVFDGANGAYGITWGERGLVGVWLPEPTKRAPGRCVGASGAWPRSPRLSESEQRSNSSPHRGMAWATIRATLCWACRACGCSSGVLRVRSRDRAGRDAHPRRGRGVRGQDRRGWLGGPDAGKESVRAVGVMPRVLAPGGQIGASRRSATPRGVCKCCTFRARIGAAQT